MTTVTQKALMTADELLWLPDDDHKYELVAGELIRMPPSNFLHGTIAMNFGRLLSEHAIKYDLGVVCTADTGFKLRQNPDTVRAPDVAFVSRERILVEGKPEKFWPGAPDLAVEVVSPSDRFDHVLEKVEEYLAAGARLVWIALPRTQAVMVCRTAREAKILRGEDELSGEDVLPGFVCRVKDLFV
ncbi:MAG: Uma2 family endonuclease [Deltaproteobacteria bacterium]|nr:Uma2 family endonuclease [Deltaproteobacteria bacterium]